MGRALYCSQQLTYHTHFYRPQRSCGKVMFLHLSVILFGGGVSAPGHAGIHTPPFGQTPLPSACWDTHTPAQCMLGRHGYCCGLYASYWSAFLLPPANELWGKVIFLHLFVIHSQGGMRGWGRGCVRGRGGHAW